MHEIAISPACASSFIKLTASRFAEVGHGRKLARQLTAGVESPIEALKRLLCVFFVFKFDVNIANHVVSKIFADLDVLYLSKTLQLLEYFFVKLIEVILDFFYIELRRISSHCCHDGERILPHMRDDDRLTEGRLVVLPRAPIAMSASSYLEIKRAIDLILFSSMDASQVLCTTPGSIIVAVHLLSVMKS